MKKLHSATTWFKRTLIHVFLSSLAKVGNGEVTKTTHRTMDKKLGFLAPSRRQSKPLKRFRHKFYLTCYLSTKFHPNRSNVRGDIRDYTAWNLYALAVLSECSCHQTTTLWLLKRTDIKSNTSKQCSRREKMFHFKLRSNWHETLFINRLLDR